MPDYIDRGPRMSQAVIHGDTVYLAGQVGAPSESVETQTKVILAQVDKLLAVAGSDKRHLLMVSIWLADIGDFAAMNTVWDEWIADCPAPARATVEARLALPEYKVEIAVTAAKI
jgi:enamine deaminase RidA (YjgF/YER057c/UK114 family)